MQVDLFDADVWWWKGPDGQTVPFRRCGKPWPLRRSILQKLHDRLADHRRRRETADAYRKAAELRAALSAEANRQQP